MFHQKFCSPISYLLMTSVSKRCFKNIASEIQKQMTKEDKQLESIFALKKWVFFLNLRKKIRW